MSVFYCLPRLKAQENKNYIGKQIVFSYYKIMHGITIITPCWVNVPSLAAVIELKFNCQ